MIGLIVGFAIGTLLSACCLWIGMRLTRLNGSFFAMLLIAAISSMAGLIPMVGWLLCLIVTLVLICRWTDASFWPHAVVMVLLTCLVGLLVTAYISNIHL